MTLVRALSFSAAAMLALSTAAFAQSADLSVTKADSPDPTVVGGTITYTIVVTNNGPNTADNVFVIDPLAAPGFSVTTTAGTCDISGVFGTGDLLQCSIPSIASGASVTIVVQSNTTIANAGVVTNTVNVSSATTDPNPANNSATTTTTVNFQPEIRFQNPNYLVNEGDTATITVVRGNTVTAATVNYSATAGTATAGTDFTAVSGTLSFAIGQTTATFTVPTIEDCIYEGNAESVMLSLSGASDGSPSQTATLNISEDDVLNINLSTVNGNSGDLVTATTSVFCAGLQVQFALPGSGGAVVATAPLTVNQCGQFAFTVPNLPVGTYRLLVNGCGMSDAFNFTLAGSADLGVVKTADRTQVAAGEILTYTMVVTNSGPNAAGFVRFSDTPQAPIVSFTTSQGTCSAVPPELAGDGAPNGILTCEAGTLASGASMTVTLQVRPTAANFPNLRNDVGGLSGIGPDPNPGNNGSSVITAVLLQAPVIPTLDGKGLALLGLLLAAAAIMILRQ